MLSVDGAALSRPIASSILAVLLILGAGAARAQQFPTDTVSAAADTIPGDTLASDSTEEAPPTPQDLAADSVIRQLRTIPGFIATEYSAQGATYTADEGVLKLGGEAQVTREGDRLTADTIEYSQQSQLVKAYGEPEVVGESQDLKGDILFYDLANQRATVLGAQTEVAQTATWYVSGDINAEDNGTSVYAVNGSFTTCDLPEPHYHFESNRIKIVKGRYMVARPARLYFGKVPVMVLPFVVQSLKKGRRSGLLIPKFSLTDIVRNSPDHTREISDLGWYWAINDYLGAQITGTWRSGAYKALRASLDYRWRRQFLGGSFAVQRYWQKTGQRQLSLNGNTSWQPDERTSLSMSANYASSSQFVRRTTFDPTEVLQDLGSTLSMNRRFDWGQLSLGANRRQSISDGSVSMTFPSFSISPKPITLFRAATPEQRKWYNNTTINWNLSGSRFGTSGKSNFFRNIQDTRTTDVQGGISSITIGNLNLSATGTLHQVALDEAVGRDSTGAVVGRLPGGNRDRASWQASIGYQQSLIGQTTFTPNLGFSQEIRRDSLTSGRYLQGPMRMNFGANLSTALFGFYPGVGPFSSIRHAITPTLRYSFSPEVRQTDEQRDVFGEAGGTMRNVLTFSMNQTWEAKLKEPSETPTDSAAPADTAAGPTVPAEPEKVTLLKLNTSAISYDFNRAARGESGFTTTTLSNTITSDYLRGLTIQMQHELFDQSTIDPNDPAQRGKLGHFSPRLSRLSTGFNLGPSSAIFRWLGFGQNQSAPEQNPEAEGVIPGENPPDRATPQGTGTATGNPQSTGGSNWSLALQYSFNRPPRTFRPTLADGSLSPRFDTRAAQTLNADMAFQLTPNWAVTWNTSYSITDGQFSGHRLNFSRELHRWQANFSFYQSPSGNSAFQFFVQLMDIPDVKVDYHESSLGIDQR